MKVKSLMVAVAVGLVFSVEAGSHSGLSYTKTSYSTGRWTTQFTKARSHALKYGLPLVVVWANPGCGNCDRFCSAVGSSSSFKSWQKGSKCEFVLGVGTSTATGRKVKSYAQDPSGYFPYCAVYLDPVGSASPTVRKQTFTGKGMTAASFKKKILKILKNYVLVTVNPTTGGTVDRLFWQKIGAKVTLKATPKPKYKFVGWYRSGKRVSTKASQPITVKAKVTYTAKFKKK